MIIYNQACFTPTLNVCVFCNEALYYSSRKYNSLWCSTIKIFSKGYQKHSKLCYLPKVWYTHDINSYTVQAFTLCLANTSSTRKTIQLYMNNLEVGTEQHFERNVPVVEFSCLLLSRDGSLRIKHIICQLCRHFNVGIDVI